MKRILFLALAWTMTVSVCFAAGAGPGDPIGTWVLQVNGDFSIPTGSLDTYGYGVGFGGEASIGYWFDPYFGLSLESGYDTYLGTRITSGPKGVVAGKEDFVLIPVIMKAQFYLLTDRVKPYFFMGAGAGKNNYTFTNELPAGETRFLGELGVGLAFNLSDGTDLFIQEKGEFDFVSGPTNLLFPFNIGVDFSL